MTNRTTKPVAIVVNDYPAQLEILARLLDKADIEARTFEGVEAAMAAMAAMDPAAPPDLIVTDLYMPNIDGWRFCRLLRSPEYETFNKVPLLVISATFAGDHPERIAADIGANAFLPAPVNGKTFIKQVKALLKGQAAQKPPRALIVEDSTALAESLQEAFECHGYKADCAHTLCEAKDFFARSAYDVAVLDYHLPDGLGDTLLAPFRAQQPGCACLMMTTNPGPELALKWMKQGATAYLQKPFEAEFLIELCNKAQRERALLRVEDLLEARTNELRESEEKHRNLFNQSTEGIHIHDLEGRILDVNEMACTQSGYSREELLNLTIFDLHPDQSTGNLSKAEILDMWRQWQPGARVVVEAEHQRKDGTVYPVEISTGLVRYGGVNNIQAIVKNITERKRMERVLRIERDLAQSLASADDLDETLSLCLDAAIAASELDAGGVYLVNPETGAMDLRHHRGLSGAFVEAARHFDADSPQGQIIRAGKPLYTSLRETGVPMDDAHTAEAIEAIAIVPIRHHEKLIGCLNIASHTQEEVPEYARAVLETLAGHIGQAIAEGQAREALRESETYYRSLIHALHEDILVIDCDCSIADINNSALRTLRLTREQVIGRHCHEVAHGLDAPCNEHGEECGLRRVFNTGESCNLHHKHIDADGNRRHIDILMSPLRDSNGTITHVIEAARDVTDLFETQAALLDSEETYRRLYETMAQGVIYQNADGTIASANPAAERILGLSYDQMRGKTSMNPRWKMILEDGTPVPGTEHPTMVALQTGQTVGPVTRGIFHPEKNTHIWLSITAIPLFAPGADMPYQAYATFTDITARKRTEDRLHKLNETLLLLGGDVDQNIETLTALCGKLMGADCVLYNRLEGGMLCAIGQWQTPPDFQSRDNAEGHLCHDVIQKAEEGILVVHNLSQTPYAKTDPNVERYGLDTYMGHPVHCQGRPVGALCALFQSHVPCTPEDERLFGIIATALGAQEDRRLGLLELVTREERFQRMLAVIPDMVSIHDPEMTIVYSNWNGFAAVPENKRVLNTKCYKTYRDCDTICSDCKAKQILATGEAFQSEEHLPDGRWIDLRVIPLFDDHGQLEFFIEWVRDITRQKLAEEALLQNTARRQRQAELIAQVASSVNLAEGAVQELAAELTEAVSKALEIGRTGVWLFNEDQSELVCVDTYEASRKAHTSGAVLARSEFQNEFDALDGAQYVDAHDPLTDPRTTGYVEHYLKPNNITSMLDAAIRIEGRNFGTLCLEHVGKPHRWRDDEIALACQLADQVALTVLHRERKRAEEALRESEARYRRIIETAMDGFWFTDLDGRLLRVNDAYCQMSGYSSQELTGMTISDVEAVETPEDTAAHIEKLQTLRRDSFETRHRRKDGTLYDVEVSVQFHSFEEGKIFAFIRDITERKRAEQALRESESRVRQKLEALLLPEGDIGALELADIIDASVIQGIMDDFFNLTHIGVAVVDLSGKVLIATGWQDICTRFHRVHPETNRNCIESDTELLEGVAPGKFKAYKCKNNMWDIATPIVIGDKHIGNVFLGQFLYESESPEYECFRAQARQYGFDEEAYIDALDRVPRWSRETVEYVMGFYARFAALISSLSYANLRLARTIEEHRRTEEARELLQSQLTQAQKMESVGRLAGGVAHDFNNMLGVILGHAELAMGHMDPEQSFYKDLEEIRKAAQRSADLTRQLLAFARQQTVAPKVLDLNEAIEGMLKMLQRLIGEDIELAWLPGKPLWPIKMDPSQIDQIMANLCVNARDAITDVGRLTIETGNASFDDVYCAAHAGFTPGDFVLLTVSDNGCGMDKDTLDKIFDPFFTTKEVGKGTGLGLPSIFGAVKQNHGFINVYSEPGHGTSVKIYLPRHEAEAPPLAEKNPSTSLTKGTETVLLVEDEPAILELTMLMLKNMGYTVLTANSPNEAIRLAGEYTGLIDLLMTDVVMPEMNGRDLARSLIARYPSIKQLFMSGYTANVIAHHGVLDEGVNFIQKPFSINELAVKVRETLDNTNP